MRADRFDLPLRVVVEDPVPGVALALQRGASGKAELVPPSSASADSLTFEFEVTVHGALPDGRPRFLGPAVQGPPAGRFVYLCVGAMAGQAGSQWSRRIKLPLAALDWSLIEGLQPGGRLIARIAGRGRDGTPACATVRLLAPGWSA